MSCLGGRIAGFGGNKGRDGLSNMGNKGHSGQTKGENNAFRGQQMTKGGVFVPILFNIRSQAE